MNSRSILLFTVLLFSLGRVNAHGIDKGARTTQADPAENDYDIKYLKFNIAVADTSTYISGDVSTYAQVTAISMPVYVFELDSVLIIDSAKINGAIIPVTNVGFTRKMALSVPLTAGTFFTAQIFYHGIPPSTGASFFDGIVHRVSTHGTHMVYTVSDPWVAKNWWPCKQSAVDKIDSVDMFVTVPAGVIDGSNGVLVGVDSTTIPGSWKYHWKTNYPIDYYLVSIAIARFAEYRSYLHFTGSTDSVLVQNFLIDTTTFNPLYKSNVDSIGLFIDYFSTLYGRYPFWKEKYGICYTDLPGGMENQTMTTIGVPDTRTIAHELTHQWFGDAVTYAQWGEVWLSEGFATYGENLFYDHFWSPARAKTLRTSYYNSAMTQVCGQVFVTDTSGPNTLFYQPNVYYKGMAVVHMLRYLAPEDTLFFQVLQQYQSDFAYRNASTADLKAIAEAKYGMNLDTFFNQWIYGKGYPKYAITWDQVGSSVIVKLRQTTSCPATTPHFSTPLQLQLHSATADTFVKVYNSMDTQVFIFDWSPAMATVYLNPDVWTLCKLNGIVSQDTTLRTSVGINGPGHGSFDVFPNPSKNSWQVSGLDEGLSLLLTDESGKVVWRGKSSNGATVVPGEKLAAGTYYLTIGNNKADSIKLVHW